MDSTNLRTDIHRGLEVESIVVHRRLLEVEIPWLSIAEFVGGGVQGRWWRWWRSYLDLSTHNTLLKRQTWQANVNSGLLRPTPVPAYRLSVGMCMSGCAPTVARTSYQYGAVD